MIFPYWLRMVFTRTGSANIDWTAKAIDVDCGKPFLSQLAARPYAGPFAKSERQRLLTGMDEIAETLQFEDAIMHYQKQLRVTNPWIFPDLISILVDGSRAS